MDDSAFSAEVEAAIAELPADFRAAVENVAVLVEAFPDPDTQHEMGLEGPWDLLGLYRGVPLPERGYGYAGAEPDQVSLYREPIRAYCADIGESLAECVRVTLIHELGHYLGYDDRQLEALERQGGEQPSQGGNE
jgi:acetylglutamate kinase